jgi:uncharacterized protein (TIGR02145 family)
MEIILWVGGVMLILLFLYQNKRNRVIENKLEKLDKNIEIFTTESKSQVHERLYVLKIGGKTIGPILLTDIPKHLVDIQNTFVWDNEKLIWKHIFLVDEIVKFCQIKKYPFNWSPKNLDVDRFRNGELITHIESYEEWEEAGLNGKPAWCYFDNDPENGMLYGKLYNWFAVNDPRGIAPEGYHIPTDQEWNDLEDLLGEDPGKILKSEYGWDGTDLIGFNALPGGYRDTDGSFHTIDFPTMRNYAYFWSASERNDDSASAWNRSLYASSGSVNRKGNDKSYGASVRYLRDY